VPIKCTWKRIIGDREYEISDVTSNAYQPSWEDIGTSISVRAIPIEQNEFYGDIEGKFGPIEIDHSLVKTLDHILASGGSKFSVKFLPDSGQNS
jgi:hypothetical protein